MNKAILTERAKTEERKDNKCKFLESKCDAPKIHLIKSCARIVRKNDPMSKP
jgi:hypothetical protein